MSVAQKTLSFLRKNTVLVIAFTLAVIYITFIGSMLIANDMALITSLASLITFREYTALYREETKNYIVRFTAFNFGFLFLLTLFSLLVLKI